MLHLAQEIWLAMWTRSSTQGEPDWMNTYAGLTVALVVVGVARAQLTFHLCLQASRAIHQDMTTRVLRAPVGFFHANPTGRILNRFRCRRHTHAEERAKRFNGDGPDLNSEMRNPQFSFAVKAAPRCLVKLLHGEFRRRQISPANSTSDIIREVLNNAHQGY